MYAIINKKTKEFVYGTDYRYRPKRQRTSSEQALIFDDFESAGIDFKCRECGKDYEIVEVRLEIIPSIFKGD